MTVARGIGSGGGGMDSGLSPSSAALQDRVQTMRREMTGAEQPAASRVARQEAAQPARGVERTQSRRADEAGAVSVRNDSARAERNARRDALPPAMATAAEDLRSRMANEASRAADTMTEAATQRALREYANAG